jgi:hypothetical protein
MSYGDVSMATLKGAAGALEKTSVGLTSPLEVE